MTPLSNRQIEVIHRIAVGMTAKEIVGELGIGRRTVEHHIEVARHKLGAKSLAHAVTLYIHHCATTDTSSSLSVILATTVLK